MRTQWTPPLEALERQAEAATALLTPLAEAATRRLQDLAEELEQAEADANAAPVGYLTRSQFARLAQVSANTLVKWHAAGSLVPAYTHPLTHYRYYKPEQVAEVRNARQRKPRKVAK